MGWRNDLNNAGRSQHETRLPDPPRDPMVEALSSIVKNGKQILADRDALQRRADDQSDLIKQWEKYGAGAETEIRMLRARLNTVEAERDALSRFSVEMKTRMLVSRDTIEEGIRGSREFALTPSPVAGHSRERLDAMEAEHPDFPLRNRRRSQFRGTRLPEETE